MFRRKRTPQKLSILIIRVYEGHIMKNEIHIEFQMFDHK